MDNQRKFAVEGPVEAYEILSQRGPDFNNVETLFNRDKVYTMNGKMVAQYFDRRKVLVIY